MRNDEDPKRRDGNWLGPVNEGYSYEDPKNEELLAPMRGGPI